MKRLLLQQQQAVPLGYTPSPASHSNGSIGMLFVVLVVIIVLGLLAGFVARLCGGRHFGGSMEYDFEGWVERTCASCIDGSMPSSPSPPTTSAGGASSSKAAASSSAEGEDAAKPGDAAKSGDTRSSGDEKKDGDTIKEIGETSGD